MSRLCFGTYAKILQKVISEHGNKYVTELLLGLIIDNENILNQRGEPYVVTEKIAHGLLNNKKNVHRKIKTASGTPEIMGSAHDYFEDVVLPAIMPDMISDLLSELSELISSDSSIPDPTRSEFMALATADMHADFLSKVFLYTLKKPNKVTVTSVDMETIVELVPPPLIQMNILPAAESELLLLMETRGSCPSCGKHLVGDKNGNSLPKYRITDIILPIQPIEEKTELFDLFVSLTGNRLRDKIALCLDCHNSYMTHPTRDECLRLIDRKASLGRNYAALETLDKMYLEEQIESVLRQISTVSKEQLSELNYNALRVKEKVEGNNILLIMKAENYVVQFYNFIKLVFSRMEREGNLSFEDLANEVYISYKKLYNNGLTQDEIFERLVDWFRSKGNAHSLPAYEIIVAFFIQNCEVFHALA